MSIAVIGDPHGAEGIRWGQALAKEQGCNDVIFLGDSWHMNQDYPNGPKVWTMPGNHEQPAFLHFLNEQGKVLGHFDNHQPLQRDGVSFNVQGIDFFSIGGIDGDAHYKNLYEQNPWLYNAIYSSGHDVADFNKDRVKARCITGEFDIMLTHDAPYPFPYSRGAVGGSEFITKMIQRTRPNFHLNGHTHQFNDQLLHDVRSVSLCDSGAFRYGKGPCMAILEDADTLNIIEPGDY